MSLSNASTLQVIDLQFNNFIGPISVDFRSSQYLKKIRLTNNILGSDKIIYDSIIIFSKWRRTKKMAAYSRSTTLSSVTVPYIDLHKATNGFSSTNLVGAGGFGSVYQGTSRHQYISSPSRKE